MEKISVKDLYKKSEKELQTLFIAKDYFFETKRDSKVFQIKTIVPNSEKLNAIRSHDVYADYVQDFHFIAIETDTQKEVFLDGHAGNEYYVSTNKDELVEFNRERADNGYEIRYQNFINNLRREIRYPEIEVVGEKSKKAKDALDKLKAIIEEF